MTTLLLLFALNAQPDSVPSRFLVCTQDYVFKNAWIGDTIVVSESIAIPYIDKDSLTKYEFATISAMFTVLVNSNLVNDYIEVPTPYLLIADQDGIVRALWKVPYWRQYRFRRTK
jgi:hypothetical protein